MELHHLHDPLQIAELNQFIVECKPEMIFIDCGAHFGLFSLAALHFGGPQATVVAIEPSPMAIKKLRQQAALNKVTDPLKLLKHVLGARLEVIHLFPRVLIQAVILLEKPARINLQNL
jgi:hypothetical protein